MKQYQVVLGWGDVRQKKEERWDKNIYEELMVSNFPKLMETINTQNEEEIQGE